jgi:signal transduction histidine kinase/CheY-like chemotaxis protein
MTGPRRSETDAPFPEYVRGLTSVVVARLTAAGVVLEANEGFTLLAGPRSRAGGVWSAAQLFAQPTFEDLAGRLAADPGPVLFRGLINLGEPGTIPVSLNAVVRRSGDGMLIVGEHDPADWERLRTTVLELNSELAETQRQLVRDIQARKRAERERAAALEQERAARRELEEANRALEETNRGVMALYAELDDKAYALQRASELKTRFLSNMTHEFRTPLNAILSLSALLLDRTDGDLTPDQETQATFIRRSAEALSDLVSDLLDLAKIEAGKTVIRRDEFTAADLFAALRGMLRPLLTSDAVALVFDDPAGIPPLRTDQGKVAQILRNFVSNALKFTERGEVRVRADLADPQTVVFSVADTGIGIAPEDRERVFEEFVQVDGPAQRRVKGTGLGLPLSRQLAHLLGGDMSVASSPGVGSTFSLRLPLAYPGPAEERPAARTVRDPSRPPVLVVEDDRETAALYERHLGGAGFQVIPAGTLAEARRALREVRPAAVVLDVILEGETALPLLGEIRRDPATRNTPVFVVTVVNGRETALALGADDYCLKPVSRQWLLAKLTGAGAPPAPVLVVDDDPIARYLVGGFLRQTNYTLIEAETGADGLRLAHERHPRLIILDLVLPDLTGFEVLDRLKADPATRDIPVIVSSAKSLSADERGRLAGNSLAVVPKGDGVGGVAAVLIRDALTRARL